MRAEPRTAPAAGLTPREVARLLRVSPDRVRRWIERGELAAVNVSDVRGGRPRYVVLPEHLDGFVRGRSAAAPPKAPRRRRRPGLIDYYPDDGAVPPRPKRGGEVRQ
jgi:excisionase family DNA binding protein